MSKYVSISISYSGNTPFHCTKCWGVIDDKCNVVYSKAKTLNYTDAMRELHKFERRLHKAPQLNINAYAPHICTKTLWGWVDEGA